MDKLVNHFQKDQVWGKYQILEKIGQGGMGVVYKAFDLDLKRYVAIKLINSDKTSRMLQKRFKNEIKTQSLLSHPNVAKVYTFVELDSFVILVMEYFDGISLHEYSRETSLSMHEKIDIFYNICSAVKYLHEQDIVHRDLKPSNILINSNKQIKIIDFGLSLSKKSAKLTKTGDIIGTPNYMPPEQFLGKRNLVDKQSDLYSLGVILYELICNRRMIEGDNIVEICVKVTEEPIISPREIDNHISKDLEKVWKNAVARSKKERYHNINDLLEDLQCLKNGHCVKRNLSRKIYPYLFAALFIFAIGIAITLSFFLSEKKIHLEITKEEKNFIKFVDEEKYEQAIHIYKNGNLLNSNLLMNSIANCYSQLRKIAIAEMERNNFVEAQKYLLLIIEEFPNDSEMIYNLATIFLHENMHNGIFTFDNKQEQKVKNATKLLNKCIEINPNVSKYFLLLGKLHFSCGNYEQACNYLQKTLNLDKENTEALELLYKIPYEKPELQQDCYQYIINLINSLDDLSYNPIELFAEQFENLENKYYEHYLKYLTTAKKPNNKKHFESFLIEMDLYQWDHLLHEKLLAWRYDPHFEKSLENWKVKQSLAKKRFIDKLLDNAQKMKQEEYRNFCYYKVLYIYNRKDSSNLAWGDKDDIFEEELKSIIYDKDVNMWIRYVTVKTYLKKYGLNSLLDILENTTDVLHKIIITAAIRKQSLPIHENAFYELEKLQSSFTNQEKEFLHYLIASALHNYHPHYPNGNFPQTSDMLNQEKIMQKLLMSPYEKVKVAALISFLFLSNNTNDLAFKNTLQELQQYMLYSPDLKIRHYIHYHFWSCSFVRKNLAQYKNLYLQSLNDPEEQVIKIILAHHQSVVSILSSPKIIAKIKHIMISNNQNSKSSKKIRFYAILVLSFSTNINYVQIKKILEEAECTAFEKTYAYMIKEYSLLYKNWNNNIGEVINALIIYFEDTKKSQDPHFQCFNFYFCSFLQYHIIDGNFIKDDKILQNILYQLYRDLDLGSMNLFLPRASQINRLKFAESYLDHSNDQVKYYALASYITFLSKEKDKDELFQKGLYGNEQTKKATALGFYQSLVRFKIQHDKDLGKIFLTTPARRYLTYIRELEALLQFVYKNNIQRFLIYKKWLHYAYTLDPENAKYTFEKGLFAYIEGKYKDAFNLVNSAAQKEPKNDTFLLMRAKILSKLGNIAEASKTLDNMINEITDLATLNDIAKMYFDIKNYESAIHLYNIIFQEKPFVYNDHQVYLVIAYINMNKAKEAKRILRYIDLVQKRKRYNSSMNAYGVDTIFFDFYGKAYPELKSIQADWHKNE